MDVEKHSSTFGYNRFAFVLPSGMSDIVNRYCKENNINFSMFIRRCLVWWVSVKYIDLFKRL